MTTPEQYAEKKRKIINALRSGVRTSPLSLQGYLATNRLLTELHDTVKEVYAGLREDEGLRDLSIRSHQLLNELRVKIEALEVTR